MRWLRRLFIGLVVIIFVAVGVGFALPDRAHIERSIVIDARPATVYAVLNGFKRFNQWSPWADLDPKTEYVYSGAPYGPGSRQKWHSEDPNVGGGSQEVIESVAYSQIRVRLAFDGMDTENVLTYTLVAEGEGSTWVDWSMDTEFHGNLLNRYFGLLFDRMIGPDFEKGLARLKPLAESLPKDDFRVVAPEVMQIKAQPLAVLPAEAPFDQAAPVIGAAYARIGAFMAASGRNAAGPPMTITRGFDESTGAWSFDAAIPLDAPCAPAAEEGGVGCRNSYEGWVVRAQHKGAYSGMPQSYASLQAFKTAAGLEDNGDRWEHYVSDPASTPESDLMTELYWPVK